MKLSALQQAANTLGSAQLSANAGKNISITAPGLNIPIIKRTYNRPPDVTDNASVGYTVNSIWQAGGKLYKPVAAPDATAAAWAALPAPGGSFADVAGASCIFAGGLTGMKQGYTGAAVDLASTVASSPVTTTVNILSDGTLDSASVAAVLSKADAGTVVTITKFYDQSGNNNHFVKDSGYLAPYIEWDDVLKSYVMCDNASGTIRTLKAPAGVISGGALQSGFGVVGNSYTLFAVGRAVSTSDTGTCALFAIGDQTNATVGDRRSLTLLTNGGGYTNISKNGTNQTVVPKIPLDSQPSVVIGRCGTDTTVISNNEDIGTVAATNGANDTAVYTSGWLGCIAPTTSGYHSTHRMIGMAISNVAMSTAQLQQVRRSAYVKYDIRPQVQDQIFAIGDSRTAKLEQNVNQVMDNWPLQLVSRLGRDWRVYCMGNSGKTVAQFITDQIPQVVSYYKPGVRNVAVVLGGVNDVSQGNTPAVTFGRLQTACATLKAPGYTVVMFNELATTSVTGSVNTLLPVLRGLVAAAGTAGMGCDYLYDLLQFAPFALPANTLYYADGLHQTQALDTMIASSILPILGAA